MKREYPTSPNLFPHKEEFRLKVEKCQERCSRCQIKLNDRGNKVNWNPEGWLCSSCQEEWTKLFFEKKLDKMLYAKREDEINRIWRNFVNFNPSYR